MDRDRHPEWAAEVLLPPPRRRRRPRLEPALIAAVILLVVAPAGAWLWLRSRGEPEPPAGVSRTPDGRGLPAAPVDTSLDAGADPSFTLPALDASDAVVRDLATALSAHPRWASWLVTDDLVRRFVVTVVNVAAGSSPASHLRFLAPDEEFSVRESDGRTVVDPASYRRYDRLTATFASLDTEGAANLYRRLHPLFEEAHRELGFPEGTFDASLARAFENLLAVRVPPGPLAVEPDRAVYAYRNPEIEARSPAAKHLLRMGPENARRVQAKLRELADALEIRGADDGQQP